MTNPFESLSNSVGEISADPTVADGAGVPSFATAGAEDAVIEVTQAQIKNKLSTIDEGKAVRLAEWSNNAELVALAAKSPNTAKYVVEVMGIKETKVEKGPQEEIGQTYPIKLPKKPSQSFDGYIIKTPDGAETVVHKDAALDWLVDNTLGYILGGNNGFELAIVENNKGKRKNPYRVQRIGISNSNPDHMRDTFQPAMTDGQPETTTRSVNLDKGVELVDGDNKVIQLRGQISGFPVFERKPEYLDALGAISKKPRTAIRGERDRKEALSRYAEMLVRMEAANV